MYVGPGEVSDNVRLDLSSYVVHLERLDVSGGTNGSQDLFVTWLSTSAALDALLLGSP